MTAPHAHTAPQTATTDPIKSDTDAAALVETGANDGYHFNIIRRAIDMIDNDPFAATSTAGLAAAMGISTSHFQRIFTAWAGISPKRYQQVLKLEHAKSLLAQSKPVLEVSERVGLSSSGRLHDMFVTWDAMTPGDFARRGAGLNLTSGWFETPFGAAFAVASDRGLCGLGFQGDDSMATQEADMKGRWPAAHVTPDAAKIAPLVRAAFKGRARILGAQDAATSQAPLALHLIGAPFQLQVWRALLAIAPGEAASYGAIASAIGNPKASRAVGSAIGQNPLAFVIPCHRALRANGALGGYHWGLNVKRAMLAFEAVAAE